MPTLRWAAHVLLFDCDRLILRAIANIAPWVERIYVAYAKRPWGYLPEARDRYTNNTDANVLRNSVHWPKITLIEGDWLTEDAQRNDCVEQARADGFDYLIIQDADEFFLAEEMQKNLDGIRANPSWAYYRNPWYLFWKTTEWVLVHRRVLTYKNGVVVTCAAEQTLNYSACFALNLRRPVRFVDRRLPDFRDDYYLLDGKCHHLSYVLSDEDMWRKISTWGHANQVCQEEWYEVKWRGWTSASRNLNPISPASWPRAVRYRGPLPPEIDGFDPGPQEYRRPSLRMSGRSRVRDAASGARQVSDEWRRELMAWARGLGRTGENVRPGGRG